MTAPPLTSPPASIYHLQAHPAADCTAVQAVTVEVEVLTHPHSNSSLGMAGGLLLRYRLKGAMSGLRVPATMPAPGPADGLWQQTCFEAFVALPGEKAYREFNFSPSGQWAAYAFSDERIRETAACELPAPRLSITRAPDELVLEAWLRPSAVSDTNDAGCAAVLHASTLRAGFTAVIQAQDGSLSYWALHHPSDRPDFHCKDGWTASITLGKK